MQDGNDVGAAITSAVEHAAPEPFNEHIVQPAAFAIHTDVVLLQHVGESVTPGRAEYKTGGSGCLASRGCAADPECAERRP